MFTALCLALAFPSMNVPAARVAQALDVPYFKTTLENGLRVVIHEDPSDPVVAVHIAYHVGSGREVAGRSGLAHLFEHMLFQGSQHVGDDQHFKLVSEAGGTLNGTTNRDRTVYFETLPSNQLELALWLEADRMGFLLPALTQEKLDNQREVVRNERRQNYENRPYGRSRAALAAALFPPGHPYSWLTIGSHADLEAATLDDVHGFFSRWYGPNNATLVIAGDVDRERTLELVRRYFGPIPRGPAVEAPKAIPAPLEQGVRLAQEDDVQLAQLTLAWPGPVHYAPDDPALDMLAMVLSESRSSVLDRALTVERRLCQRVSASNQSGELAGTFDITLQAAPGVTLDELEAEVQRLLGELAERGIDAEQLERLKTRYESDFVRGLETVAAKASALAEYDLFLGQPGYFGEDLARHLAVTPDDVRAALKRYLVGQPYVALSVVPRGKRELAASGRSADQIAAESAFDRAAQPGAAARPTFRSPAVWHAQLDNGVRATGTPFSELPLTTLRLALPAGRMHESQDKLGLASLTAEVWNEGTRELSTTELADALDALGADLSVSSDDDEITLSLSVLDRHLPAAVELLADVLLEPRLDQADFERRKAQRLTAIDTRGDNIGGIARTVWSRLVFGAGTIEGAPSMGTRGTVERLSVEDVRRWQKDALARPGARLVVASGLDANGVRKLLAPLVARWPRPAEPTALAQATAREASARPAGATRVFLVDKPGAAQSEVRVGYLSVSSTDPDWWALQVLNHVLGGAFSSRINLNLREAKGWTYGARTGFSGGLRPAPFAASASVERQHTAPAVGEMLRELEAMRTGPTAPELEFARSSLTQSQLRQYESARARLSLVDSISLYGWPDDFVERRLVELEGLGAERLTALAERHLRPTDAIVLVVGDKREVLSGLSELGLGPVQELDIDGEPIAAGDGSR
jgi:zinc protease